MSTEITLVSDDLWRLPGVQVLNGDWLACRESAGTTLASNNLTFNWSAESRWSLDGLRRQPSLQIIYRTLVLQIVYTDNFAFRQPGLQMICEDN